MRKNLMLIDGINLILAIALIASPWVLAFPTGTISAFNAVIAGFVIGAVAIGALVAHVWWEELVNLAVGLWVLAAPYALGFTDVTAAFWTHVTIGLAVAVLAAVELWFAMGTPPARTATG